MAATWIAVKYHPLDQAHKLMKMQCNMTVNIDNIVDIRETDNDVGKPQCHLHMVDGIDYTIPEPYISLVNRLKATQ